MSEETKNCPFKNAECTPECALYIQPEDLNETVRNKLSSLGVFNRTKGLCSLKNIALGMSRHIFENTTTNSR